MTDQKVNTTNTPARWGVLGTLLCAMVLVMAYAIVQTVSIGVSIAHQYPGISVEQAYVVLKGARSDGSRLAIATIAVAVVLIPMLFGVIKLKRGSVVSDYLALKSTEKWVILKWVLSAILLGTIIDVVKITYELPINTAFAIDTYLSMGDVWLFLLAFIVLAPVLEELFFRGFLLSGLERSFMGPIGAVVFVSALWAAAHSQYEPFYVAWVFVLGCIMGASRVKTGSIYPALVIHVTNNALAFIGVAVYVNKYYN